MNKVGFYISMGLGIFIVLMGFDVFGALPFFLYALAVYKDTKDRRIIATIIALIMLVMNFVLATYDPIVWVDVIAWVVLMLVPHYEIE